MDAQGGLNVRKFYEGDQLPDAGQIGITSGATPEDQYLISNYSAAAANELKRQGKTADPRTATIVREGGHTFIQMNTSDGSVGRVPLD